MTLSCLAFPILTQLLTLRGWITATLELKNTINFPTSNIETAQKLQLNSNVNSIGTHLSENGPMMVLDKSPLQSIACYR